MRRLFFISLLAALLLSACSTAGDCPQKAGARPGLFLPGTGFVVPPRSDKLSFLIGSFVNSLCPEPLQMSGLKTRQVTVILDGLA